MSNQPAPPPAAPTSSTRITEICIGYPDEYDGKAETAQAWMDSVQLYLLINHALYYDNDRKITFALSYMKKGSAATWAEVCRQQGLATVAHAPPAMVFVFLFLFAPLFAAFLLTTYVALCKPGCAVSAADTSSV